MIPISTTILHGLLICIPFTIFALVSFWCWPRLWLHSLPPDIVAMAGQKTAAELRQTNYLLIPVIIILPGLSAASTLYAAMTTKTDLSLIGTVVHLYSIWIIVHLWDFVVIDCGHALFINAQRPPIAGTEGAKGYRDYGFHFRAFLRATFKSILFVIPTALILSLVS